MATRNIVIIGGGYGGVETYLQLSKKNFGDPSIQIVLISQSNFFYHTVASPRSLVQESFIPQICIPYNRLFTKPNSKFIHGKMISVSSNEVKYICLDSPENTERTLNFEHLVLAVGSTYVHPFHANFNDRSEQIAYNQTTFNQIKEAQRVLVIGGGSVGVELAGELATDYSNKEITLISSNTRLLATMSQKASDLALSILGNLKVQVIFKEKIDFKKFDENFKENQSVTLSDGKKLEFDAYFQCVGVTPNTQVIKECQPDWIDNNGFIKVNGNLQVLMCDSSNIFAIGDCCDTKEEKMALKAADHAVIVANNIYQLVLNRRHKLQQYKLAWLKIMIVTIGRDNAIFQMGYLTISGCVPVMIKSKTLFLEKFRNMLGYSQYQEYA